MLVIHDEQLAKELQKIAERERRPVEDVLKSMVAHYPAEAVENISKSEPSEAVKRVRRKAYAKARLYWQSVGDTAKAEMTDEKLDEQFGAFDEAGIPRLKSELKSLEPPPGSLAYAAKMAKQSNLHTGNPNLASQAEDILNTEFADYLLRRTRGEDAAE
ncbi:MAG: hypothetical protein ABI690_10585 [Chloroflexota bacterium]